MVRRAIVKANTLMRAVETLLICTGCVLTKNVFIRRGSLKHFPPLVRWEKT